VPPVSLAILAPPENNSPLLTESKRGRLRGGRGQPTGQPWRVGRRRASPYSAGSAARPSQLGSRCYRRLRSWTGHILAPAPIGTMRAGLSVASVSAIASASVVARALVGRSCGVCATAGTIKGRMEKPSRKLASRSQQNRPFPRWLLLYAKTVIFARDVWYGSASQSGG
jgi:hypothetical protein